MKPIWKSDPNWTQEEFIERLKTHNQASLEWGVTQGWWESVDNRGNPVAFPQEFSQSEHPTMATIMVALEVFPSVNQARKNGWDTPTELGIHTLTKKRLRIKIVP